MAGPDGNARLGDAGDELTFRIAFDNNDNNFTTKNIRLIDTLPSQVNFVRASDDGLFGHTTFSPTRIRGRIRNWRRERQYRRPGRPGGRGGGRGTRITNNAMIEVTARRRQDRGGCDRPIMPSLRIQKTLVRGALDQPDAWGQVQVEVGATLTYMITFSNPSTNRTVTEISIVDTLPREVRFVSADGDREFGFYDPNTHTYTWRYAFLELGREQRLNLVRRGEKTPLAL
jgi:uncharacterized repeat protein (TIGR01451 family)